MFNSSRQVLVPLSIYVGLIVLATCSDPSSDEQTSQTTSPASRAPNSPQPSAALPASEEIVHLFDYDPQAPLDIQVLSSDKHNTFTTYDLTYASPKGGRVPAYLVVPTGPGPFAGMLVQHGLPSSRDNILGLAQDLAQTGAVVLAINAPFARTSKASLVTAPLTFTEQDRTDQIQLIIDLCRGIDLLTARPDVVASRIAYVGISYGAAMGGLLAGIERRIKAYSLMVGDGGPVAHFTAGSDRLGPLREIPKDQQEQWLALMEPIEPIHFVSRAAPAALFFQNALHDTSVAHEDAVAYQLAGSEPKRVQWYPSDHQLPREAFLDQVAWLANQIGIDATKSSS